MKMNFRPLAVIALMAIGGCGESDDARYDAGYSDGYAVGFNTACEIRATLIEGNWEDTEYSRGYAMGQTAGVVDCNASRQSP